MGVPPGGLTSSPTAAPPQHPVPRPRILFRPAGVSSPSLPLNPFLPRLPRPHMTQGSFPDSSFLPGSVLQVLRNPCRAPRLGVAPPGQLLCDAGSASGRPCPTYCSLAAPPLLGGQLLCSTGRRFLLSSRCARLPPPERTLGRLSHLQSCPPRKFAGRRQVPLSGPAGRWYGEKAAQMFTRLRLRPTSLLAGTPGVDACACCFSVHSRQPGGFLTQSPAVDAEAGGSETRAGAGRGPAPAGSGTPSPFHSLLQVPPRVVSWGFNPSKHADQAFEDTLCPGPAGQGDFNLPM